MYRFFDRSRENLSSRGGRDFGRDSLGLRDGSEMVVSDACVKGRELMLLVLGASETNVNFMFLFVLLCCCLAKASAAKLVLCFCS